MLGELLHLKPRAAVAGHHIVGAEQVALRANRAAPGQGHIGAPMHAFVAARSVRPVRPERPSLPGVFGVGRDDRASFGTTERPYFPITVIAHPVWAIQLG
ncbi:MAG: hypothetical protein EX271_08370 [Acidimicrobiales bacterium]|nr:MAG: hypothetical protein EX271_08370 [Acidimicrobiales bacterium]